VGEPSIAIFGVGHLYDAVLQINMAPLKIEDFSPSHPCIYRHHNDGFQVPAGNGYKTIHLVFCQVTQPPIVLSEQLHGFGWILIEVTPLDGRIEQVLQPGEVAVHGSGSYFSDPGCLEPLHLSRGDALEPGVLSEEPLQLVENVAFRPPITMVDFDIGLEVFIAHLPKRDLFDTA